jgi:hypothetical protein
MRGVVSGVGIEDWGVLGVDGLRGSDVTAD